MSYITKPSARHPSLPTNALGLTVRDYEGSMSTLCAGCGHDSITAALVQTFFELDVEPGETIGPVKASVFLGVCQEICIPVQAELATGPDAMDDAAVAAAFAALPGEAHDSTFEVSGADGGQSLRVAVMDDDDGAEEPDLFVTFADGWYFDEPSRVTREGGRIVFDVPIAERPSGAGALPEVVDLLFTRGGKGISASYVTVSPTG